MFNTDTDSASASSSERTSLKSLFKSKSSKPSGLSTTSKSISDTHKVFWLQDYLVEDIPDARVWTYGYNADVISDLFQSNNQNSVSQHGRDLAVQVEREIENEVCYSMFLCRCKRVDDNLRIHLYLWHIVQAALFSKM